jgi:hypothetical protein
MESRKFLVQQTLIYEVEATNEVDALTKVNSVKKDKVTQVGNQTTITEVEVEDDSKLGKMAQS